MLLKDLDYQLCNYKHLVCCYKLISFRNIAELFSLMTVLYYLNLECTILRKINKEIIEKIEKYLKNV